jgi:hypothetical protein
MGVSVSMSVIWITVFCVTARHQVLTPTTSGVRRTPPHRRLIFLRLAGYLAWPRFNGAACFASVPVTPRIDRVHATVPGRRVLVRPVHRGETGVEPPWLRKYYEFSVRFLTGGLFHKETGLFRTFLPSRVKQEITRLSYRAKALVPARSVSGQTMNPLSRSLPASTGRFTVS